MSLRARLTFAAAAAVAVAVVLVATVSYFTVRQKLVDEVDRALVGDSDRIASEPGAARLFTGPTPESGGGYLRDERAIQILLADGQTAVPRGQDVDLPVDGEDRRIARREEGIRFRDATVDDQHVRVMTRAVGGGAALQVSRPLTETDNTLGSLRLVLGMVSVSGIAIASGLGFVVSRAALRPVTKLTRTAEHVAETQDLGATIEVEGHDEVARLAATFNGMLAALDASRQQQRQLVADASHELRTPLTSLRTNIEVLARQRSMPAADRERLLDDVVTQLEELSVLVGDLVELAREDGMPQQEEPTEVRLDEILEHAVARARRHTPTVTMTLAECPPTVMDAQPALLERAFANVLDNACKWSPPGGEVEVELAGGTLTVRDHGPGIDPADLPHVFDRFYRAPAARSMPGSGLGLAIVRHAAEAHGGTVTAEAAPGGGTLIRLRLPGAEPVEVPPSVGVEA